MTVPKVELRNINECVVGADGVFVCEGVEVCVWRLVVKWAILM